MKNIKLLREQLANSISELLLADMGFRWFAKECRFERWNGNRYEYIFVDCFACFDGCTITSCAGIGFRQVAALLKKCPLISSRFRSMCDTARPVSYSIQLLPRDPTNSWSIRIESEVEPVATRFADDGVAQGISLFSRLDSLEQLIEQLKSSVCNETISETETYILSASLCCIGNPAGGEAVLCNYIDRQKSLYANPRVPSARLAEIANAESVLSWLRSMK